MSAWIVSTNHIRQMVDGAIRLGLVEPKDATTVGRMLTNANKRSIRARYGEWDEGAAAVQPYWHTPTREPISDLSLLMQLNCYDYQTCEFDGYERSTAYKLVERMRKALAKQGITRNTPGYNDQPWGV